MQKVTADFVKSKKVLLRYDIDVQIIDGQVTEDYKLKAGLATLDLCLENAVSVILMGHVGRPEGKVVKELRVAPIVEWFKSQGLSSHISSGKLKIMENLRFDPRESFDGVYPAFSGAQDLREDNMNFAKELAQMGDIYINEAFSAYRSAVSTTILPTLLLHAAGLNFTKEVEVLTNVRNNPKKPFIAIMGGAKVEDKLPVIQVLAQEADAVLVGGKLVHEIKEQNVNLPANVLVGKMTEDGFDVAFETVESWGSLIAKAAMIVWNGPLGKFEDPQYDQTEKIVQMMLDSGAEIIVGGGDSVAALNQYHLLEKVQSKGFVSVGGGAMLKFLSSGTLPTIEALA